MAETLKALWIKIARFFYITKNFVLFLSIKKRHAQNNLGIKISLRMIEYAITNHCATNPVNYLLLTKEGENCEILEYDDPDFKPKKNQFIKNNWTLINFVLKDEYDIQIKIFGKRLFDPCSRGERIFFKGPQNINIETSLGQLKFFHWAIPNGVIRWVLNHAQILRKSMQKEEKEKLNAKLNGDDDFR